MPQQFAIGDSYGGLAGNALGLHAQDSSDYFQALADQRRRETEAQTVALQQEQLAQAHEAEQNKMAQAFQFHQDALTDSAATREQQAKLMGDQLNNQFDIANLGLVKQDKAIDKANNLQLYKEAMAGIENGTITTPEHLDVIVGDKLDAPSKKRLTAYIDNMHLRLLNNYDAQQNKADQANALYSRDVGEFENAAKPILDKAATAPVENAHWWNHIWGLHTPLKSELLADPVVGRYNRSLDQFDAMMAKDKMAGKILTQDAATHRFAPLAPPVEDYPGAPVFNRGGSAAPGLNLAPGPHTNGPLEEAPSPLAQAAFVPIPSPMGAPALEARADVAQQILQQADSTPMLPGEHPANYMQRKKMIAVQLARQQLGTGAVRPVTQQPAMAAPGGGLPLMQNPYGTW